MIDLSTIPCEVVRYGIKVYENGHIELTQEAKDRGFRVFLDRDNKTQYMYMFPSDIDGKFEIDEKMWMENIIGFYVLLLGQNGKTSAAKIIKTWKDGKETCIGVVLYNEYGETGEYKECKLTYRTSTVRLYCRMNLPKMLVTEEKSKHEKELNKIKTDVAA